MTSERITTTRLVKPTARLSFSTLLFMQLASRLHTLAAGMVYQSARSPDTGISIHLEPSMGDPDQLWQMVITSGEELTGEDQAAGMKVDVRQAIITLYQEQDHTGPSVELIYDVNPQPKPGDDTAYSTRCVDLEVSHAVAFEQVAAITALSVMEFINTGNGNLVDRVSQDLVDICDIFSKLAD